VHSAPMISSIGAELLVPNVRAVTPGEADGIKTLVYRHKLVVFRNQQLSNVEYIEFAKKFGTPQIYLQKHYHHPDHPEIFVSSNVPENGRKIGVAGTGRYWHTDYQFHPQPLPLTMLYPKILPRSKRETYYIDMQMVYENLSPQLRSYVDGRVAIHDAKWRYKVTANDIDRSIIDILKDVETMVPPTAHPAVIQHPATNVLALYISSGFTAGLSGMSPEKNKCVMQELFDFIEQEEHVYVHAWHEGDILLWDNRTLLHKASEIAPGEQSCSYRIGIYDGLPFYVTSPLDRNGTKKE